MTEIEAIEALKNEKRCEDLEEYLHGCVHSECYKCHYYVSKEDRDKARTMAIQSLRETGHVERCVLDARGSERMTDSEAKKELEQIADDFQNERLDTEEWTGYEYDPEEASEAVRMGIKALERQRWIPVSERMPEEYEIEYTIYDDDWKPKRVDTVMESEDVLVTVSYDDGSKDVGLTATINGKFDCCKDYKITAWMPLPEPYEESE